MNTTDAKIVADIRDIATDLGHCLFDAMTDEQVLGWTKANPGPMMAMAFNSLNKQSHEIVTIFEKMGRPTTEETLLKEAGSVGRRFLSWLRTRCISLGW